jgi:hypothetical protein
MLLIDIIRSIEMDCLLDICYIYAQSYNKTTNNILKNMD